VPGRDGAIIQSLAHATMPRPRNLVLFDWEEGVEPGIGDDLAGPFETLGAVTARMHRHARSWRRPAGFTRLTWDFGTSLGDETPHWGRWRDGMGVDGEREALFGRTVAAIGRRLARYGKAPERFGLIHCDLRLANLLIDGETVKVIDFDDCGFGWYLYDLATLLAVKALDPDRDAARDAWVAGYRSEAPLPEAHLRELETLVMARGLLLVGWMHTRRETKTARLLAGAVVALACSHAEKFLASAGG
jgi:Ser/Thr protein kinase RdoA (MazF antagonist)